MRQDDEPQSLCVCTSSIAVTFSRRSFWSGTIKRIGWAWNMKAFMLDHVGRWRQGTAMVLRLGYRSLMLERFLELTHPK